MYDKPFHNKDISKLKFLVTGGAGFVGSHLVEYLLKYNAGKVIVLDNLSTGFQDNVDLFKNNDNFEFVEGDISCFDTCLEVCRGVDYILHQAALGSVPRSIKYPLDTNKANVTGFLNMLNAAKEMKVKRFIYASSSSVYGDSPDLPKTEKVIGNPLSPYAVSKRINELYADVFYKNYGLEVIGLRYFNIFGPRQSPSGAYAAAIPLFIFSVLNKTNPDIFGDGKQSRDFTFVENAVEANIKALFVNNSAALGKVFNVALGEKTTVNDLFQIICSIDGASIKPVYKDERKGDIKHSLADISMTKKIIGYEPCININEGLKITYNWFKEKYAVEKN